MRMQHISLLSKRSVHRCAGTLVRLTETKALCLTEERDITLFVIIKLLDSVPEEILPIKLALLAELSYLGFVY